MLPVVGEFTLLTPTAAIPVVTPAPAPFVPAVLLSFLLSPLPPPPLLGSCEGESGVAGVWK